MKNLHKSKILLIFAPDLKTKLKFNTMEIRKRLEEIANLLYAQDYDGEIYFGHKSYDDENDIPHLIIDDKRVNVEDFIISRDATKLVIVDDKRFVHTLDMTNLPEDWNDVTFEEMGMFNLLQDVYYETNASWEIGDYELDFIKD